MTNLFTSFYEYYWLVLVLQAVCVIHAIRRGNQRNWLWIIVFLPAVGCIAYIFTEVINRRHISSAQSGLASVINPTGRIKKLEHNFSFSPTFANRVALADAYLQGKQYDKAIELYEPMLNGIFDNNEDAIKNLMEAYYKTGRYADVVRIAPKVASTYNFNRTKANLYYAQALEEVGNIAEADAEFKKICVRFANYEQRYNYGMFLLRQQRSAEASTVFKAIIDEGEYLSGYEKTNARPWVNLAKQEYKKAANAEVV